MADLQRPRLYVGPWVEFHVPPGESGITLHQPEQGGLVLLEPLQEVHGGEERLVLRFVPVRLHETEMNPAPKRELYLKINEAPEVLRLDGSAAMDEKAWFFASYGRQIQRMREASGIDPVVGWGLIRGCA